MKGTIEALRLGLRGEAMKRIDRVDSISLRAIQQRPQSAPLPFCVAGTQPCVRIVLRNQEDSCRFPVLQVGEALDESQRNSRTNSRAMDPDGVAGEMLKGRRQRDQQPL